MKIKQPLLTFDFANKPLTFTNPIKVITAHTIEEVIPCFVQIQEAIDHGYYVAGYLSYESAPAFDSAYKVNAKPQMPLLWFGIFSEPQQQSLHSEGPYSITDWTPSVSMDEYEASIQSIKNAIEDGDTYQTNYTIRLHSQFEGDEIAYYTKLKKAQSSNYCAYLNTGEYSFLSASPELFFHLKNDEITTRPMKGTIKRGKSFEEDEKNARWLYQSEKNRAENVMIVDLLRNDLGMIAVPGTVQVPELFNIEQYPTVHQMTSTITAKIMPTTKIVDIFRGLFPCGSITGAPKISTMEIIADLESESRDVYCGAIGYITPSKEAIFNVPIRTVVIDQKSGAATYGVGGGITWDSTTAGEYEEILAKASLLKAEKPEFQLLESLLLKDGEYFLLEEHLSRLENSAKYFNIPFDLDEVRRKLTSLCNEQGEFKVRLVLGENIKVEAQPITRFSEPLRIVLADKPIDNSNLFLYHKTTHREVYSQFQKRFPEVFDVLLWNSDGELTEFTNGNVVVELDGQRYTPPISSGLLGGTYRQRLLAEGEIQEKVLKVEDLRNCTIIWFINSVRKWLEVELK
ncbi:aminodeoxychorismate synthase component I [Robertmurraya kyonggiensis]|uniref:Aminodeoxychorismate synthase component I n=1 Tax=Robertmurraya kyonggiensis TaxID=1037680 RepID=A0A4U1D9I0_9BACI|nr:aminodeoxychorismate synthase component I [Robertmurraya kyonggiensis]TKC19152.1 aminodeoxychorismate synthase component I [Robertmurraya kyonggiensis]